MMDMSSITMLWLGRCSGAMLGIALCFACKHVRMLHFRIFARDLASLVQLSLV